MGSSLGSPQIESEAIDIAAIDNGATQAKRQGSLASFLSSLRAWTLARYLGAGAFTAVATLASAPTAIAGGVRLEAASQINRTVGGEVSNGMWKVTIDLTDCIAGSAAINMDVNLNPEFSATLSGLNGTHLPGTLEGNIQGSRFSGKLTVSKDGVTAVRDVSFSVSGSVTRPASGGSSGETAGGGRRELPIRPAPRGSSADACKAPEGGVRLMRAYDPCTFFVDDVSVAESMGVDGQPRGFDVNATGDEKITFFVTGPAPTRFKVFFWLPVTAEERGDPEALKATVTIDGIVRETTPQPIDKGGKIILGTEYPPNADKNNQIGLWSSFVVTPPYKIGAGTHAVAFRPDNHNVRVTLIGPDEVTLTRPDHSEPAVQVPFEEDPMMPAEFSFPGTVAVSSLAERGYVVEGIEGSPLAINAEAGRGNGLDLIVCPLSNSPNVHLVASRGVESAKLPELCHLPGTGEEPAEDKTVYRLARRLPAMPNTLHNLRFERTVPPSHSDAPDAPDAPDERYIDLAVGTDGDGKTTVTVPRQPGLINRVKCQVNNVIDADPPRANGYCWGQNARGQTAAYQGSADTRLPMPAAVTARRHLLKKVP